MSLCFDSIPDEPRKQPAPGYFYVNNLNRSNKDRVFLEGGTCVAKPDGHDQ